MGDKTQATKVVTLLKREYPNAKIVLKFSNPWELLVSVILSAQCTDVMVNKVTEKLFAKYKTLEDYVKADSAEFEGDIKSTGFFHAKAKNILATAKLVKEKFGGKVPQTMTELLTLSGVARKTGNVVLGNAFNVVEGIAVDTHVSRVSQRLRLVDLEKIGGKKIMYFQKSSASVPRDVPHGSALVDYKKDADPVKIEQQLMEAVPRDDWFNFTYLLIDHGRAICKAQNPNCSACVLNKVCPSSRV